MSAQDRTPIYAGLIPMDVPRDDTGAEDTAENYIGESLGWENPSRWPEVPMGVKFDAITQSRFAAEFCEQVLSEMGRHEGLRFLQAEADRLESLALRASTESEYDPDLMDHDAPADSAWWNAVVFVNKARYLRKYVAGESLLPKPERPAGAVTAVKKPKAGGSDPIFPPDLSRQWHNELHNLPEYQGHGGKTALVHEIMQRHASRQPDGREPNERTIYNHLSEDAEN